MNKRIQHKKVLIDEPLYDFIQQQVLPGTGISADHFWSALSDAASEFMPRNKTLLAKRQQLQQAINNWHKTHQGDNFSRQAYQAFLTKIGYLEPAAPAFQVSTDKVDAEISLLAAPQLVVPVMNARYALNATNARWGSLYDALYGSDVISAIDSAKKGFSQARALQVIAYTKHFLDSVVPLAQGSYLHLSAIAITDEVTDVINGEVGDESINENRDEGNAKGLLFTFADGTSTRLADTAQFVGYQGSSDKPEVLLLKNNGLHIEIHLDSNSNIGRLDGAGICDVIMEAALTCIQDGEDSIAAVDSEDKIQLYKNWLGLMKGDLQQSFLKNGENQLRQIADDRHYTSPLAEKFTLSGRSLLLVRNVGHLMMTDAVLSLHQDRAGEAIPEGILDAFITSLIALHDINDKRKNSRHGSIYIVKPKMHGSAEVAFSCDLFAFIEQVLGLAANTIKIGLMDEERRTSVNLSQCLYQARERVAFINTGFMDRTGDEIHTSMFAGIMVPKEAMKKQAWIQAYEAGNVQQGLRAGMQGKGQIGKGMWPIPDKMSAMMLQKISHLQAGASCAWVPSPTAAVLHAMHYHRVNVSSVQQVILANQAQAQGQSQAQNQASLNELLTIPLQVENSLTDTDIQQELSNNIQGILGYVVRWVELGIGCSKVPDMNDVGLMEDRATLRISCQHIANWLLHDVVSLAQIRQTMEAMAVVVDKQNCSVKNYQAMAANFDESLAFKAAYDLIVQGKEQPSGYTEPLLHQYRRRVKQRL